MGKLRCLIIKNANNQAYDSKTHLNRVAHGCLRGGKGRVYSDWPWCSSKFVAIDSASPRAFRSRHGFTLHISVTLVFASSQHWVSRPFFKNRSVASVVVLPRIDRSCVRTEHNLPLNISYGTTISGLPLPCRRTLGGERHQYAIACPDRLGSDPTAYGG